ncbi:methyl-accepting chemotaxis protein [bacterium]|nr:methyl-accepting chemotaxis protein [bacterium]
MYIFKRRITIKSIDKKIALIFICLWLAGSSLLVLLSYQSMKKELMSDIRTRVRDYVALGVLSLPTEKHALLQRKEDEGGEAYQQVVAALRRIRGFCTDIRFVYTIRRNEKGQASFVADAEENADQVSHLGDVYEDAPPLLQQSLGGLTSAVVENDFYTDEWGTFLSAYAPILTADGRQDGLLGIDISLENVQKALRGLLWRDILLLVITTVPVILVVILVSRRISNPITVISKGLSRLAEGDLNQEIDIHREDEVGMLADSLREVIRAIKQVSADLGRLTDAALNGRLQERADVSSHNGSYAELVKGLNDLLVAVSAPINETSSVLEKAAAKDLTPRVGGDYHGQFADLRDNVNRTLESLSRALSLVSGTVREVVDSVDNLKTVSDQVNSASGQISSGSQALAAGANEQASSLEEISASLEQIAAMTRQNADNANQAKSLTMSARASADKGALSMQRMREAIMKIKDSSDRTARIVKTIDEIAFQTNLLALNAAVEAARAGEAGKGFAVVAEEVRSLAQRSAQAAKDTSALIEESVHNAEGGVEITAEVAASLEEIAEGTRRVNDLVSEIAAAALEQSTGIEQVNTGVSQLDRVTQQNASGAEESASSAEELNAQAGNMNAQSDELASLAEGLTRMVTEFSLSQGAASPAAPSRPDRLVKKPDNRPAVQSRGPLEVKRPSPGRPDKGPGAKPEEGTRSGEKKAPRRIIPRDDKDIIGF